MELFYIKMALSLYDQALKKKKIIKKERLDCRALGSFILEGRELALKSFSMNDVHCLPCKGS